MSTRKFSDLCWGQIPTKILRISFFENVLFHSLHLCTVTEAIIRQYFWPVLRSLRSYAEIKESFSFIVVCAEEELAKLELVIIELAGLTSNFTRLSSAEVFHSAYREAWKFTNNLLWLRSSSMAPWYSTTSSFFFEISTFRLCWS